MIKKFIGLLMIAALMTVIVPSAAIYAHSPIEQRTPAVNDVLSTPPERIDLVFEDPVEVYKDSVVIADSEGKRIPIQTVELDPQNSHHVWAEIAGDMEPVTYTVKVRVVALDGHPLEESYTFTILAPELTDEERFQKLRLVKSYPEEGTVVQASPSTIELWYSDAVDVSVFGILDDKQKAITMEPPVKDPKDPGHLIYELKEPLSKGTYSIHSQVQIGEFQKYDITYFAVEEVTSISGSYGDTGSNVLAYVSPVTFIRWLSYVGLLTLAGVVWFQRMIGQDLSEANKRKERFMLFLHLGTMLMLGLEFVAALLSYAQVSWVDFLSFQFIRILILQLVILGLSWVLKAYVNVRLLLLLGSMLGWIAVGHSMVPDNGGWMALTLDSIHVLAASIWLGGLAALLLMVPAEDRSAWLMQHGKRFSPWAVGSVVAIILSGIGMTILYVPMFTLFSLWASAWGKMLLAKLLLFFGLVGFGIWQRKLLRKWSLRAAELLFKRNTMAEIGIISFLLLFTAILVDASPDEARQGLKVLSEDSEVIEQVKVTPLRAGANDVILQLKKGHRVQSVQIHISSSSGWIDEYQAFRTDSDSFLITGNLFHSPGTLTIDMTLRSEKGTESKASYVVYVPGPME